MSTFGPDWFTTSITLPWSSSSNAVSPPRVLATWSPGLAAARMCRRSSPRSLQLGFRTSPAHGSQDLDRHAVLIDECCHLDSLDMWLLSDLGEVRVEGCRAEGDCRCCSSGGWLSRCGRIAGGLGAHECGEGKKANVARAESPRGSGGDTTFGIDHDDQWGRADTE